ncbi:MAG TPA: 30S ribosomal protein S5, partial [Gemmataceae bacterium]|nr:30S ribosomal protein S5 [Gemmataceae bacterium]
ILVPAGPGTGVKAGPGVRDVLTACGIHNILTKVHGSTNAINLVKATIDGLKQLRTREEVAALRGVAL